MYVPAYHRENDPQRILEFLRRHDFATLYTAVDDRQVAVHLPLLVKFAENKFTLLGHVAAANPVSAAIRNGNRALVTVLGPHTYVSSSWYEKESVPTWNYQSVHLQGSLYELEKQEALDSLSELIELNERRSGGNLRMADISERVIAGNLRGIVAFGLAADEVDAAFKLSGNKGEQDRRNVADRLAASGNAAAEEIARLMRERLGGDL